MNTEGFLYFEEESLKLLETPEALLAFLYDIHEEYELMQLDELLEYYLELEKYEFCGAIKTFIDNEIDKK